MSNDDELELDDEGLGLASGGAPKGPVKSTPFVSGDDGIITDVPGFPLVTNFSEHHLDNIG